MRLPRRSLPAFGDLEMEVLEHVWSAREVDVTATHATIGKRRGISTNTIGSALERLFKKGFLLREKVSHSYRYRPAVEREEFAALRVLEAVGGAQSLSRAGLLSAFVDLVADVDEAALDRLEALIAKKRARSGDS
jgi:predicted transcriptional regulator